MIVKIRIWSNLTIPTRIYSAFLLTSLFCCCNNDDSSKLLSCEDGMVGWEVQQSIYPNSFIQFDYYFPSRNIGYSVGKTGTILKTNNGGETWSIINDINSGVTKLKLTEVFFLDENNGYVGGERMDFGNSDELLKGALLLRTSDGGIEWNKEYYPDYKEFHDLYFLDANIGMAIISFNLDPNIIVKKIMRTSDGGQTWFDSDLGLLQVLDEDLIIFNNTIYTVVRDFNDIEYLVSTVDFGETWSMCVLPDINCNRIEIIDSSNIYLICGIPSLYHRVYQSKDNGLTWVENKLVPLDFNSIFHVVSQSNILIFNELFKYVDLGGELLEVSDGIEINETINSGVVWDTNRINSDCNYSGIYFRLNNSEFYIMGNKFIKFTRP